MHDIEPAHDAPITPSLSEARERSLNEDLQQLTQDAKAYAEAELKFQKSRASYALAASKSVVLYALVAAVLLFFAVMALVVGLIIALAPLITAWGSTALVTGVLLASAVFLLLRAKKRIGVMTAVFGNGGAT